MGTLHQVQRRSGSSVGIAVGMFIVGRIVTEGREPCQLDLVCRSEPSIRKKSSSGAPDRKKFMVYLYVDVVRVGPHF